jgi:hypothetical protein
MPSLALSSSAKRPAAGRRCAVAWLRSLFIVCMLGLTHYASSDASEPALTSLKVVRGEEGLLLDYALDFELPKGAEDALNKAVPLYFVAEAEVFRDRWYWRDKRVASASRLWRIVFQPLTLSYRVTFGGLSQTYATRDEALAAMRRGVNWRIAEPGQLEEGGRHYVEFSFRLDTSLLPRPMQIGIGGQPDWSLAVERSQRFD